MTGGDMRAVIQRVKRAGVKIFPGGAEKGRIGAGLLVLVAVEDSDSSEDARVACVQNLRAQGF